MMCVQNASKFRGYKHFSGTPLSFTWSTLPKILKPAEGHGIMLTACSWTLHGVC